MESQGLTCLLRLVKSQIELGSTQPVAEGREAGYCVVNLRCTKSIYDICRTIIIASPRESVGL